MIKNMKFIRFGGLSPTKQSHYREKNNNFHTPPMRKGIYAFPEHYVEYFLIGGTNRPDHISGKSQWIRDDKGEKIKLHYTQVHNDNGGNSKELMEILKEKKIKRKDLILLSPRECECDDNNVSEEERKKECKYFEECEEYWCLASYKKPKKFIHKGMVWHHLEEYSRSSEITHRKNTWVKSQYSDYIAIFNRMLHSYKKSIHAENIWTTDFKEILQDISPKREPYTSPLDHLEVFIERIMSN